MLHEFLGSITEIADILLKIKEELNESSFPDIPQRLNSILNSKNDPISKLRITKKLHLFFTFFPEESFNFIKICGSLHI